MNIEPCWNAAWRSAFAGTMMAAGAIFFDAPTPTAQPAGQYRAFWVDTFNTPLNNHNDIVQVVDRAIGTNANAIFAQVRRRGDAWYLNSLEPPPDFTPIAEGFDPLEDLIAETHLRGLEVHAFVIIGAVWNKNPRFLPSPTLGPPTSPNHVFNLHGFNQATGAVYQGRDNWLTRTLLDDMGSAISFQGHRFGNEFWMDPGHPDAAAYTVDVLMHLVRHYDIDGLHLDRIRYPEISIDGQTSSTGVCIGFNETSVLRFQQRYGFEPACVPSRQAHPLWNQWRRDQVSHLVRRIYLNALAIKPQLKVSAALIAFGAGPRSEPQWNDAEAFWRVYQDWRVWTEEGILDLAIPMNYKTEHSATGPLQFDQWNEWTRNHAFDRAVLIGQGAFLNAVEGSVRQTRRALAPSNLGPAPAGIVFFSAANTNVAVTANPFSIPSGQDTPQRVPAEFAASLVTGRSVDGTVLYEDPAEHLIPIFHQSVPVPALPWKSNPQVGHLMGFARYVTSEPIDGGEIVIERLEGDSIAESGRTIVTTTTDGGGFYGGVDLAPGVYRVTVTPAGGPSYVAPAMVPVVSGSVASLNIKVP